MPLSRLLPYSFCSLLLACNAVDSASVDPGDDGKTDALGAAAATKSIATGIKGTTFALPATALDGSGRAAPHNGSYVSLDLPAAAYLQLKDEVAAQSGVALTGRGEAHITVITPPEFAVVKKKLTMSELDQLAARLQVQAADVHAECLGVGKKTLADQTVYVVVTSQRLAEFRAQVQALYVNRGGKASGFSATNYHPHVTVGFTRRDLQESDGVIKDVASCPDRMNLLVQP